MSPAPFLSSAGLKACATYYLLKACATYDKYERLLVLVDDLLQLHGHLRKWYAADFHRPIGRLTHDDVDRAELRRLVRIVVAEMAAAAFFPLDRASGHGLRHGQQVAQIDRRVPARIVF